MPAAVPRPEPGPRTPRAARTGSIPRFTLTEACIVLLVLATLAALSLPHFLGSGAGTRSAAAERAGEALRTAAERAHLAWLGLGNGEMGSMSVALPDGSSAALWRGYPDAGNCCAVRGIESLVDVSGLTTSQTGATQTRLEVPGAPNPALCSATYTKPRNPGDEYSVSVVTTGC